MTDSKSATGAVIWFTGLPSSGKSTIARGAALEIRQAERPCLLLDGDEVRRALIPNPGYDAAARDAFYDTLARLASLSAAQGLVVLVAATANRRAYRERARQLTSRFIEVFVDTPIEECMRRDSKGLYARARGGEAIGVPGANEDYEPPENPAVVLQPNTPNGIRLILDALQISR